MIFTTILGFLKTHWKTVLIVVGMAVGYVYFHSQQVSFADQMKKIQQADAEAIKKIEDARAQEEQQHRDNEKILQDSIVQIQTRYEQQIKALSTKKRTETNQIIQQYQNDPAALAQKFADATGFKVVKSAGK